MKRRFIIISLIVFSLTACSCEKASFSFEIQEKSSPQEVKVAFIGDQGLGEDSRAVLRLIKAEQADMVLHQGDFDYEDSPDKWDEQINEILGNDFPYFASIGNHDEDKWPEYQKKMQERLERVEGEECSGDLGINSSCTYKGIFFILSGIGTLGTGHEQYIESELGKSNAAWKICSWHKDQRLMQVEGKDDDTGWQVYEECRKAGAIIATAHAHTYSRTHLMNNFEAQSISSVSNVLEIDEGKTFAFVSGLGGKSIRSQNNTLASNPWWALVYTEDQDANFGALFCIFNYQGIENRAHCYFKDIENRTIDEFDLVRDL